MHIDDLSPETAVATPDSPAPWVAASSSSQPRKRRHFKSRLGCGICKRRKIKCDESRPGCANCTKHGVECDFLAGPASTTARSTPARPSRGSSLPATPLPSRSANLPSLPSLSSLSSMSSLPPQTFSQPLPPASQRPPPSISALAGAPDSSLHASQPLQITHLELLHNYSTLTSYSLSADPVLRNVWRLNVPQEGFRHDFVLRSVFALSALHMAAFAANPADKARYLQVARAEHGAALREFVTALSRASADNCSALYISAVMTFMYAWAAPRQPGDIFLVGKSPPETGGNEDSGGDGHASTVADWFPLVRGLRSITDAWLAEILRGPFGIVMRLGHESLGGGRPAHEDRIKSAAWQSTAEHAQFEYLRRVVLKAATADPDPHENPAVYATSLDTLERSFVYSYSTEGRTPGAATDQSSPVGLAQTSSVYAWLYCMEDAFVELVVQRRPLALVVFAHFCVLLRLLSGCWWMQGASTHLMQEIWDLLDADHRLWIRWPIEELGWRPSK
ncbi:hypothetical protein SCUCBS95973_001522 [Sporothrix curviconia]|uniref:Zn(2)-C6 fungal-type domain-containing protein n=1 Tax=Sporothrix curviconia TaxID=1260050 RepID=A0ABP0AZA1_9PEZI